MSTHRASTYYVIALIFLIPLTACGGTSTAQQATHPSKTQQVTGSPTAQQATNTPTAQQVTITPTNSTATPNQTQNTPTPAPTQYTQQVILRNQGRPDDLAFDLQGHILISDPHNGTLSQVNTDGTGLVVFAQGLGAPEGLVVLADGTVIIAEQSGNSILALAPGRQTPTLLRTLPGTPSTASCKDGVDGIAFDPTTNTLIVPDSPEGTVYRMSLDGKTLTLLASGITRPVGATVDSQGNIYIADECGGAVVIIAPNGQTTRIGGFGMPDDVVLDQHGNILVTDLASNIHSLIRMNLSTGQRETLTSTGFIEPQGLLITDNDTLFMSDDSANILVELIPV